LKKHIKLGWNVSILFGGIVFFEVYIPDKIAGFYLFRKTANP
tara:strand:- start:356 stop:481 length:126 start_codon:yes stop_codon:yes gene_type:complete